MYMEVGVMFEYQKYRLAKQDDDKVGVGDNPHTPTFISDFLFP